MTEPKDAAGRVTDQASGLAYSSSTVDVDGRTYQVIEVAPTRTILLGADRLERLDRGDKRSDVDTSMLEICANWNPPADAVVFVANPSADRSWRYAENLEPEQIDRLGRAMVEGQLALYRGFVRAGIYSLTGIALGEREFEAFSRGTELVAGELERQLTNASDEEAPTLRLNLWLVDHLALWTTLSRDRFFKGRLPETLSLIERRRRQIESMDTDILESGVHQVPRL